MVGKNVSGNNWEQKSDKYMNGKLDFLMKMLDNKAVMIQRCWKS